MKSTLTVAVVAASLAFAQLANAVEIFYGSDIGGTVASEFAYSLWLATVPDAVTDQLDGLAGTSGIGGNLTSSMGNGFTSTDDSILIDNFGLSPAYAVQGEVLRLQTASTPASFTWTLATASNAFGVFGNDIDGGSIKFNFVDGNSKMFELTAFDGGDNIFLGLSGLESLIASVTISTTDPGGVSFWDRFSYSANATTVPEPGSIALFGLGLVGLGFARRRRRVTN